MPLPTHPGDDEIILEKRGRDRRQSLLAQALANNHAIGHVVTLLQQIAYQKRESEAQNHLPHLPLRQIRSMLSHSPTL